MYECELEDTCFVMKLREQKPWENVQTEKSTVNIQPKVRRKLNGTQQNENVSVPKWVETFQKNGVCSPGTEAEPYSPEVQYN